MSDLSARFKEFISGNLGITQYQDEFYCRLTRTFPGVDLDIANFEMEQHDIYRCALETYRKSNIPFRLNPANTNFCIISRPIIDVVGRGYFLQSDVASLVDPRIFGEIDFSPTDCGSNFLISKDRSRDFPHALGDKKGHGNYKLILSFPDASKFYLTLAEPNEDCRTIAEQILGLNGEKIPDFKSLDELEGL